MKTNEQTIERIKQMKLYGMLRAFNVSLEKPGRENLSPDEFLSQLVEAEWDERYERKLVRSIKGANFRYRSSIEQLSFEPERNLDKNQIMRLADCDFVERKEVVLVTGYTGTGKSSLISALGHQACEQGYRVLYQQAGKLFGKLKLSKADGSYLKELAKIERMDLLILDDFGIQPLDSHNRAALMEIMEDRHGKAATIFASQVPVNKWYEIIGEQTIADAILDRIVHDAHRIEMKGESLRKNKTQKNGK